MEPSLDGIWFFRIASYVADNNDLACSIQRWITMDTSRTKWLGNGCLYGHLPITRGPRQKARREACL